MSGSSRPVGAPFDSSAEPPLERPVSRRPVKTFRREEGKRRRARRAAEIYEIFAATYPTECELIHRNPFELLIATILSAQTTDAQVNKVTPGLFAAFPDAPSLGGADPVRVEPLIGSLGFFRQKAKSIVATSRDLSTQHGGEVPRSIEALTKLRGVGRKTANVVLGTAFDINEGIACDTHVQRVTTRLALSIEDDVNKREQELMTLIPQPEWSNFSHRTILHGRRVCDARKPACERCPVRDLCPSRSGE